MGVNNIGRLGHMDGEFGMYGQSGGFGLGRQLSVSRVFLGHCFLKQKFFLAGRAHRIVSRDFWGTSFYEIIIFSCRHHGCLQYTDCLKSAQIRRFFWSVFSRIRTEYGEIIVQMQENTDQKKLRIWTLFTQ